MVSVISVVLRCGTVMDFVVSMMLDLDHPVTSVQNAASFGYFDCIAHQWNTDILAQAGFPADLLPKVVNSGETAGCLPQDWFDVPAGTPVRSGHYFIIIITMIIIIIYHCYSCSVLPWETFSAVSSQR